MALRTVVRTSPNVALASGELYPNGVDVSPANPDIQATVRPLGWLFHQSAGYPTVRVGTHKIDIAHPSGQSIHFTPVRLAENLQPRDQGASGPPAMIDMTNGGDTADIADLPGSEYLDGEGKLPAWAGNQNRGPYLADGTGAPVSDGTPRYGGNVARDMGDRDPERFVTKAFYDRLLVNPNVVLRDNFQQDPVITSIWAIFVVGGIGLLAGNIERAFRSRAGRGRGVAASAGAAPAAAAEGTLKTAEVATAPVVAAAEKTAEAAQKVVTETEKIAENATGEVTA